jgi:hypothetical protein
MNPSFLKLFFDVLFRLFDQEKQTLLTNARSASSRGILDTFYNYDQVEIGSEHVIQHSILVHLDGSLVATDGAKLSKFGIVGLFGKDLRESRYLVD